MPGSSEWLQRSGARRTSLLFVRMLLLLPRRLPSDWMILIYKRSLLSITMFTIRLHKFIITRPLFLVRKCCSSSLWLSFWLVSAWGIRIFCFLYPTYAWLWSCCACALCINVHLFCLIQNCLRQSSLHKLSMSLGSVLLKTVLWILLNW